MTVRTRFAPSPTGYMHIGGMRTALFNWLWARRNRGVFILRIDDTDQQRNMDEALGPILQAFRWLGLDWDEGPEVGGGNGPYFQSQRRSLYDAALQRLLAAGDAYRDFESAQETQRQREEAEREKRVYISSRDSLQLTEGQIAQKLAENVPCVIRLKVPRTDTVVINDHVRGTVEWDCGLMPDPVIARSDGSPLYNFATVVDDAAMQITHVIRAEEHLSNTPIQVLLHRALGNDTPEWAHIPYVAAPGGREKISKRKIAQYRKNPQFKRLFEIGDTILTRLGFDASADALSPVMVAYYQQTGFIPAGVLNALVRLGWSFDDQTEILSLEDMQRKFSLDRVIRSPAGLDPDKLLSFQAHWMSQLPAPEKLDGCLAMLQQAGWITNPADPAVRNFVQQVMELAGDRLRLFGDIFVMEEFFVPDAQLSRDEKAFEKRITAAPAICGHLRDLRGQLEAIPEFTAGPLHELLQQFAASRSLRPGDLFPALRLCISGKAQGADMFRSLELLGRDRVLRRLDLSLTAR
ncbi:MAG: glutamate--tRNA ligase [Planctomycetota bacterium]